MEAANISVMARFIQQNLVDCGHVINYGTALLIANIVTDYLSLCGIYIDD